MSNSPFNFDDLALLTVELPDSLKNLRYSGRFADELREIDRLLSEKSHPSYDPIMTARLQLERFIAAGMADDYGTSFADMVVRFREKFPSFADANLLDIIDSGHADYLIKTDGVYFEDAAYSNICGCCDDYLARLNDPAHEDSHWTSDEQHENMKIMREAGRHTWHYKIRQWIKPDENHESPGKKLRVWLPFPAITPEQSDIRLLAASHQTYISDSPIRTAYAEFPYHPDERFEITLEFTNTAVYHDLRESAATDVIPPDVAPYLAEVEPHIVFTPYLKKLAAYLTSGTSNPLAKARRIYDYVTTHVRYSYMREYRLFDNIPMYAAVNGRGDCGVQALLFITLCRIAGVPARWQSGNAVHPGSDGKGGSVGSHDWAMFYIAPYGWLYCDPSYGGGAKKREDAAAWDWYFGNLDPYRYVSCTEFQRQLDPPKKYMRLDPYDNQSGELEYENVVLSSADASWSKKLIEAARI